MKRVNQEGEQRLIEYGVSAEKFDPKALPLIKEFKALSAIEGCKLIEAFRNYTETSDEAFDIALTLYRENITGFEILSVNPELVDCPKFKILYKTHLIKTIWGNCEPNISLQFAKPLYDSDSEPGYDETGITGGIDVYNELDDSSSNHD